MPVTHNSSDSRLGRGPGSGRNAGLTLRLGLGGIMTLVACVMWMIAVSTAAPPTLKITIATFFPYYSPQSVHIETGIPVSWENPTANLHSITHDGCLTSGWCAFDSGPIGPNQTFTVQQLPAGYYPYHCTYHPIMRGVLVVRESGYSGET